MTAAGCRWEPETTSPNTFRPLPASTAPSWLRLLRHFNAATTFEQGRMAGLHRTPSQNVGLYITVPFLRLWGQVNYVAVLQALDGASSLGFVVFWHIRSGMFVRRDKPANPVILSPGYNVVGFRLMYLDRRTMAVTARARWTPPNQSGENATGQHLFGPLAHLWRLR